LPRWEIWQRRYLELCGKHRCRTERLFALEHEQKIERLNVSANNATPFRSKPRILFVEDEEAVRSYLAEKLSDEYIVDTAGNGVEALKAVMRRKPDLVVTDIVMPEMDGVELLRTLRSEPATRGLPILLISGRAGEAQRIEGFHEGADGYLAKPYSVSELRAVVGAMLQAAELRAEAARRKATQHALAERAALLESITDAFYALDRHLRFTYINHRALDYFKKGREELLGRCFGDVFPVIKGTMIETQLEHVLREQCSAAFETFSPVSQSWVELNIYPATQGLAVYFRDISDRKRAEQELQRAEESLRQSDRRKSEFLALLAHELRNPLAPIANGVKILRLRAAADATSDRTLDMMERQLKHLVRLVDDLLDVGRITSGKLQLRTQRVAITDVLETAVESIRNRIEIHGQQLVLDIGARDLVVEADPDRMVQVFANLLANSTKYTERGGRIVVTLERQGHEAVVAVTDNGIGIPAQSIGEVFEMFSQLENRPTHAEGGLGIGLALVHRLVHMHGGIVSAGSEGIGRGSTFTVRLPLAAVADPTDVVDLEAAAHESLNTPA
jgi:PAS domain S-box-containing protein